jgi:hypothetical protein
LGIESLLKLNKQIILLEYLISSYLTLLHKIVQIKNEIVIMKLHFRYHVIFGSKIKRLDKDCKYCQDWLATTIAPKRNI